MNPIQPPCLAAAGAILAALLTGCSPLAPGCRDETKPVLELRQQLDAGGSAVQEVVSPRSSNLRIVLQWTDPGAVLGLAAAITSCGGHIGCQMLTLTPSPPVSGAPPAMRRELLVDGWQGKTYRIDVTGDPTRATPYTLSVTYEIRCES